MKQLIQIPCFSNGTEFMWWLGRNCDHCTKSPKYHNDKDGEWYSKSRCKIRDEIDMQAVGNGDEAVSYRTFEATHKTDCPFIQKDWPKRKRTKKDESLNMFEP